MSNLIQNQENCKRNAKSCLIITNNNRRSSSTDWHYSCLMRMCARVRENIYVSADMSGRLHLPRLICLESFLVPWYNLMFLFVHSCRRRRLFLLCISYLPSSTSVMHQLFKCIWAFSSSTLGTEGYWYQPFIVYCALKTPTMFEARK